MCAQVNAFWLVLPQAISGLFLVATVVGLLRWSSDFGRRLGLTLCAYLALFAFVGFEILCRIRDQTCFFL